MTVSEASVKAVYEHVKDMGDAKFNCDEIAVAMGRSRENVRETLSTLAKRGLIEKLQKPQKKFCGNTLLYRRTQLVYVEPDASAEKYDFSELLAAWRWRPKESTERPKFGEFACGTCL